MRRERNRRGLLALLAVAVLFGVADVRASRPAWVLIDTDTATAEVFRGYEAILSLPNVSLGRGGAAEVHLRGDRTTPTGEYRVTRINRNSRFHVFIGLDYPTLAHVDAAHRRGLIDEQTYLGMLDYARRHGELPQNSPLGGYIGIHGLGRANPSIHSRMHWTQGCVAVTNEQIETLLRFVTLGTTVVIQ